MKKKKLISFIVATFMSFTVIVPTITSFADNFNVVTMGENLSIAQRIEVLNYLNIEKGTYKSEANKSSSISVYIEPSKDMGLNVKAANFTSVTASMIKSALITAGIDNSNIIVASPVNLTGLNAIDPIILGYEKSTKITISDSKEKLANEEINLLHSIAQNKNVRQDKAVALINGIKEQVLKGNKDYSALIKEESNNYEVTLTDTQKTGISNLMEGISKESYNTKNTLKEMENLNISINKALKSEGELDGFMNNVEVYYHDFLGIFESNDKNLQILNNTNNSSKIGAEELITATSNKITGACENDSQFNKYADNVKKYIGASSTTENIDELRANLIKQIISDVSLIAPKEVSSQKFVDGLTLEINNLVTIDSIKSNLGANLSNNPEIGAVVTQKPQTNSINLSLGKLDENLKYYYINIELISPITI